MGSMNNRCAKIQTGYCDGCLRHPEVIQTEFGFLVHAAITCFISHFTAFMNVFLKKLKTHHVISTKVLVESYPPQWESQCDQCGNIEDKSCHFFSDHCSCEPFVTAPKVCEERERANVLSQLKV